MCYREVSASEQEFLSLGDAACVFGRMRLSGWRDGVEKRFDNRFLAVWVRRQDGWRLAAFQPTPVAP
jgi:ketosteroid isomerase-like protein